MPTNGPTAKRKQPDISPWRGANVDVDSLSESQRLAHDIVVNRRDLTPSVERIMSTDLGDSDRSRALIAFRDALTTPGDPNRDPQVAIANARTQRG